MTHNSQHVIQSVIIVPLVIIIITIIVAVVLFLDGHVSRCLWGCSGCCTCSTNHTGF